MPDKSLIITPVALANGTYITNLVYPAGAGTGGVGYTATASRILLTHIMIINTTAGALTFRLHVTTSGGAASAANSVVGWDRSVTGNSVVEWYGQLLLDGTVAASYLVGGASGAGLTFNAEGKTWLI